MSVTASLFKCAAFSGKLRNSACMTHAASKVTAGAHGITDDVAGCRRFNLRGECALPGLTLKFVNFI
jgi:hypothetical protein